VEINRKKVTNLVTYRKVTKDLKIGDSVLLLVKRGPEATLFVAFTL